MRGRTDDGREWSVTQWVTRGPRVRAQEGDRESGRAAGTASYAGGQVVRWALRAVIIVGLRGSSRGHRIIAERVVVLGLGGRFSAIQVVSDINISPDISAPRQHEQRVVNKWDRDLPGPSRRRSRAEEHFLTLEPVTARQHRSVEKGGLVRITSRAGRLDIPWIVRWEDP